MFSFMVALIHNGDLWVLNTEFGPTPTWLLLEPSLECGLRSGHNTHLTCDYLYIFCGISNTHALNDVWKVNHNDHTYRAVRINTTSSSEPEPRYAAASAYLELWGRKGSVLIYGGARNVASSSPLVDSSQLISQNTFWRFDLSTEKWINLSQTVPALPGYRAYAKANTFIVEGEEVMVAW